MSHGNYLLTSESVSEGHPDKICDLISDKIVDLFLSEDPEARTAIETLATTNHLTLAGEYRGPDSITKEHIIETARNTVKEIGYEQEGFHWAKLDINYRLHGQSPDIAQGVDSNEHAGKEEGAGDQGIMFGYASDETEILMPAPIHYAHRILQHVTKARKNEEVDFLGPDAKCQVTLRYENHIPVSADSIVLSTQHTEGTSQSLIKDFARQKITEILPHGWMCRDERFFVNPTGKFVIGGPDSDTGLTGRKIIVDSYGGAAPHGGGAFSGKDPTKVDRSANYMARYLAKNIVAAGLAKKCLIQLAYVIGVSFPVSIYVDTYGTAEVDDLKLATFIKENINLTPRGIRETLGLNRPIYAETAAYGHFGRMPDNEGRFSWEKLDLVEKFNALN